MTETYWLCETKWKDSDTWVRHSKHGTYAEAAKVVETWDRVGYAVRIVEVVTTRKVMSMDGPHLPKYAESYGTLVGSPKYVEVLNEDDK